MTKKKNVPLRFLVSPALAREVAFVYEELRHYSMEQAKKLNIRPTMRELDRLIHEHRKLRRLWEEA